MSEELLILDRCPFCNGAAYFDRKGTARQSCIVSCEDCGARLETGDAGEMCGHSWNQRTSGERIGTLEAENGRLREALEEMITVCEHADFSAEGGMPGEGDAIASRYIERARATLAGKEGA